MSLPRSERDARSPSILLVKCGGQSVDDVRDYLKNFEFNLLVSAPDSAMDAVNGQKPVTAVICIDQATSAIGLGTCRDLLSKYEGIAVLFLSDSYDPYDEVLALESGAIDYVHAGVEERVLLARIRSSLKIAQRGQQGPVASQIKVRDLVLDRGLRMVRLGDKELPLTGSLFELLWVLASNAGVVLTREEIGKRLYGVEHDQVTRSIDGLVTRLRKMIELDAAGTYIKTVRGRGYAFAG